MIPVVRPSDAATRKTREYRSWHAMISRCYYEPHGSYHNYGGRGISVCERWHNFHTFCADMAPRPADRTLDRIDVNGGYEPSNCRWATVLEQNNNRRKTRRPRIRRAKMDSDADHWKRKPPRPSTKRRHAIRLPHEYSKVGGIAIRKLNIVEVSELMAHVEQCVRRLCEAGSYCWRPNCERCKPA